MTSSVLLESGTFAVSCSNHFCFSFMLLKKNSYTRYGYSFLYFVWGLYLLTQLGEIIGPRIHHTPNTSLMVGCTKLFALKWTNRGQLQHPQLSCFNNHHRHGIPYYMRVIPQNITPTYILWFSVSRRQARFCKLYSERSYLHAGIFFFNPRHIE